jgi:hypothetical protein
LRHEQSPRKTVEFNPSFTPPSIRLTSRALSAEETLRILIIPRVTSVTRKRALTMLYMSKHTGGQYFSAPPSGYAVALEAILMQLHFRCELGFIHPAIDGTARA